VWCAGLGSLPRTGVWCAGLGSLPAVRGREPMPKSDRKIGTKVTSMYDVSWGLSTFVFMSVSLESLWRRT
jgi:hypothetical protein